MPFAPTVSEHDLMKVGKLMRAHTASFITPVTVVISHEHGEPCGSGTFIELRGKPYLLTNEHVAVERMTHRLAHFVGDGMKAAAIVHPFRCLTHPTDAAIARIDEDIMQMGTKRAVPTARIAQRFEPAEGEIAFIHGYPGKTSRFSAMAQGILARTCPYAADIPVLPPGYDADLYFALSYPGTTEVKTFEGQRVSLPDPHGLSGTLVWDTRFVAVGKTWVPDCAVVAGLVWGWDEHHHCLIATKIEVLRSFFLEALRFEAAYFHWLDRGSPAGDEWTDWFWAQNCVSDLQ